MAIEEVYVSPNNAQKVKQTKVKEEKKKKKKEKRKERKGVKKRNAKKFLPETKSPLTLWIWPIRVSVLADYIF